MRAPKSMMSMMSVISYPHSHAPTRLRARADGLREWGCSYSEGEKERRNKDSGSRTSRTPRTNPYRERQPCGTFKHNCEHRSQHWKLNRE